MEEMKRSAVHTQTAAMLEMGTNLLSQSAEQTRKLTDVETQVSLTGDVVEDDVSSRCSTAASKDGKRKNKQGPSPNA